MHLAYLLYSLKYNILYKVYLMGWIFMAWVSETSATLTVDDWGEKGSWTDANNTVHNYDYSNCYAKAILTVSTDGDTVNWTINMTTSVGNTGKKPAVKLYLAIVYKFINFYKSRAYFWTFLLYNNL